MHGDQALIELAATIPGPPLPLDDHGPEDAPRREARRAGYSRLKPQVMSAQGHCSVRPGSAKLGEGPAPLLFHDCRAVPGESGSALLQIVDGRPAVIGVLVASRPREDGQAVSVAVPTAAFRAEADAMLRGQGSAIAR